MKKILLGCVSALMLGGVLSAKDYYAVLDQAEKWIDSTYKPGSLANTRAQINLRKIDATTISNAEKIVQIKKDFPQAFQSAQQADTAQTMFNRGEEYYKAENYTEAVKWFRKAAEQGHAEAQKILNYLKKQQQK